MKGSEGKAPIAAILAAAVVAGLLGFANLSAPLASSRGPRHHALHLPPPHAHPSAIKNAPLQSLVAEPPTVYAPDFYAEAPTITSGTWTPITHQPSDNNPSFFAAAGIFLLTDGRILLEDADQSTNHWFTLTPDINGSYINGTWTQVASPGPCANGDGAPATTYSPVYYASAVLPDGRFVMIGGEYNYNPNTGTAQEVWTAQGAIYDPVGNTWSCIAPPTATGWTQIGDAQSVVLPDGTYMIANPFNNQVATLNTSTNPPTFNAPFTPPGKATAGDSKNDEEGWILLPNGTVLTTEIWNSSDDIDTPFLAYNPATTAWSSAGTAPDPLVLISSGGVDYFETGPLMLRPDGTVLATGATGFNDIYNIAGDSWSSGPSFPTITDNYNSGSCVISNKTEQLVEADAPAALLPDGNVLLAPGPIDDQPACQWVPPSQFFEFDGTTLTRVNDSFYANTVPSFVGYLLVLPTGQVLYTNTYDYIELYNPSGTPDPSWAPTIKTSPPNVTPGGANYSVTGTQFNGLSQASTYGDDFQDATNYPLVRITNNATGHVFYCRTHNHSTMAVATGSATVSTEFDVPAGVETGASTIVVVANGISSTPVAINVSTTTATPTATATATPTATATATPTPTPTATPTPVPDRLKVTPSHVNFGKVKVGKVKFETLTLDNSARKGAPITFANPIASFQTASLDEFRTVSSTCGAQLAPGKTCKMKVEFAPSSVGAQSSSVTIFDNAGNADQVVTLSGKGD